MNKEQLIETFNGIVNTALEVIDSMEEGERIRTPELAQKVAERLGLDTIDIIPFMTFFSHNYDGVETSAGRNGGIYKGKKPVKVSKVKQRATGNTITDMLNGINDEDVLF